MAFKAESNIVTAHGTIANGEVFNPDTYQMSAKEIERLISIGSVSRVAAVSSDSDSVDGEGEEDTSEVDENDHRKQSRKTAK